MANDPLLVTVPKENVNDETVRLASWRAADRSAVDAGAVVAEIETSKAVVEVLAPVAGHVRHAAAEGAVIAVGSPLCYITAGPDDELPFAGKEAGKDPAFKDRGGQGPGSASGPRFSKKALELMIQHSLDKDSFAGQGLVRESDVLDRLRKEGKACPASREATHLKGVSVVREDLPRRKAAEIASLSQGQNAGLSSLVAVPCSIIGLKEALLGKPELAATPLALIVSETARLLRHYPALNAFYEDGRICRYEAVHVGFVIDADHGLAVPVVRDADKKDLKAVARDMQDLMLAYEEGSLTASAVSNGTFTVTDLSAEGAVFFHPLINERQAAILGVAAARGDFFDLILSFDHRLTEGREAARFLRDLAKRMEASPPTA